MTLGGLRRCDLHFLSASVNGLVRESAGLQLYKNRQYSAPQGGAFRVGLSQVDEYLDMLCCDSYNCQLGKFLAMSGFSLNLPSLFAIEPSHDRGLIPEIPNVLVAYLKTAARKYHSAYLDSQHWISVSKDEVSNQLNCCDWGSLRFRLHFPRWTPPRTGIPHLILEYSICTSSWFPRHGKITVTLPSFSLLYTPSCASNATMLSS